MSPVRLVKVLLPLRVIVQFVFWLMFTLAGLQTTAEMSELEISLLTITVEAVGVTVPLPICPLIG